jgi:hypothetical protein
MEQALGIAAFFGVPMGFLTLMVWIDARQKLGMKELEIRRIEAEARLKEAERLGDVPAYVDRADPAEVSAWKRARAETSKVVTKQI